MPDTSNIGGFPLQQAGYLRTPFGTIMPPSGQVAAFVRGTNGVLLQADYDSPIIMENLYPTLAAGLNKCRPNRGDTVMVLEGHTENIIDATPLANLQAGTRITGVGVGSDMPAIRWTNIAAQLAFNKANVCVTGIRFRMEGANGITKAVLVTGTDNLIADCEFEVASGAALKSAIVLEVGAGANRFKLLRNYFRGTATHNVTDGVKVVAAVEDLLVADNLMHFSATAANGNIHVTAAALRLAMLRNILTNDHTASTACVAIDAVAATGVIADTYVSTINNGTATSQGITLGAGCLVRAFQSFSCDQPILSGILTPLPCT